MNRSASISPPPQRTRVLGKISLGLLVAGVAAVALVAGLSFLQVRPEAQSHNANTQIKRISPAADSAVAKTAEQLRNSAMQAYQAGQLFAPAGDNAIELYLSALAHDPNDFGAKEAIFELIPPATMALEAAINAANSGEVERLSTILAQADPSSTRTTALIARARAQIAANLIAKTEPSSALQTDSLIAQSEIPPTPIALPNLPTQASTAVNDSRPVAVEAIAATSSEPATAPINSRAPAPKTPAPVLASLNTKNSSSTLIRSITEVVDAKVIKSSPPMFPAEAKRRKATGWVDLKLQVDASGRVTDAAVVDSKPGRIFDAEAKRAVMRWQFSPKLVDNKAVASIVNQRITFKPES